MVKCKRIKINKNNKNIEPKSKPDITSTKTFKCFFVLVWSNFFHTHLSYKRILSTFQLLAHQDALPWEIKLTT